MFLVHENITLTRVSVFLRKQLILILNPIKKASWAGRISIARRPSFSMIVMFWLANGPAA